MCHHKDWIKATIYDPKENTEVLVSKLPDRKKKSINIKSQLNNNNLKKRSVARKFNKLKEDCCYKDCCGDCCNS